MEPRRNKPPDRFTMEVVCHSGLSLDHIADVMGLPKPKPTAEIQREAIGRSRRLCASHSELRAILDRHEATIQKRWIKKTKTQREAILLKAWPNMATVHRPYLAAFKKHQRRDDNTPTKLQEYRDHFVWPHINLEDLSTTRSLLLLLSARGRHHPCDFAAADGEAMRMGRTCDVVVFSSLASHVMLLNGAVGPEEYGKMVPVKENTDAFELIASRKQFLPGPGLIILEAQERILSFLVSCCKQILHDFPEPVLTSNLFPITAPPQLKTEADTAGFKSLAIMAAEAPYRVPAKLDFGRIESLLSARASAAEDHMWSLREDPGYFSDTQREIMDHRQEYIKDENGKLDPILEDSHHHLFRALVVNDFLLDAHMSLELFSELRRQAQDLRVLQKKYAPAISPSSTLPEDYLQAILKFRCYLKQAARWPTGQLKHISFASPPIHRLFERDSSMNGSPMISVWSKLGIRMDRFEMRLIGLLRQLWDGEGDVWFVRMPLVMDELQRLLESGQEAKELVSPYVARVIGDLSIISQCFSQLELYQPWANGFELEMERHRDDIVKDHMSKTTQIMAIFDAIIPKNLGEAAKLGNVSGGRFAYPIDKRRTKENVEILRRSEAHLDSFWACIDRLVHTQAGDLEGTAVRRLLSQPRIIQRTPEWIERMKELKKKVVSTPEQEIQALYKPLSELYFGLASSKPDGSERTLRKPKVKTRGTAEFLPITDAAVYNPLEDSNPSDPQPTIPVDARALKVFRTLFFTSSPTAMPGEVAWNDFLHALTSTGFAAEKLYGSVWQFRPTALDVERSIQFHEPHPRGKIPYQVARRHGRRLNRAYGWFGGMFTLKEKRQLN